MNIFQKKRLKNKKFGPWVEYDLIGTLEQSNHSESFFASEVADGSNDIK